MASTVLINASQITHKNPAGYVFLTRIFSAMGHLRGRRMSIT